MMLIELVLRFAEGHPCEISSGYIDQLGYTVNSYKPRRLR
jgi:hypothetical protein